MASGAAIELQEVSATAVLLVGDASELQDPSLLLGMTLGELLWMTLDELLGMTLEELLWMTLEELPGMMLEEDVLGTLGTSSGATLEELFATTLEELSILPVTELELSGVSMAESCGTLVDPVLFESEEQADKMAPANKAEHAAATVINEIPNFWDIPRI